MFYWIYITLFRFARDFTQPNVFIGNKAIDMFVYIFIIREIATLHCIIHTSDRVMSVNNKNVNPF